MSIRSFIAIPIEKPLANSLGDLSARMAYQDKSRALRWVDQANYHLTLAFLGEQHEQDLQQLAESLDECLPMTTLELTITHLSPFPEGRPKLIAAMLEKTPELIELHQKVLTALRSCSIAVDKRKFNPHITLARYRHSRNPFAGIIAPAANLHADASEVSITSSL